MKNFSNMIRCKICNKEEHPENWTNSDSMIEHQLCFDCEFWRMQHQLDIEQRGEHNWCVIDGRHYVIDPDNDSYFKGFGGAEFHIQFDDGTIKITRNLWHQGEIPEEWKNVFPNNAKFLKS